MSNIVKRLRSPPDDPAALDLETADEIERLQEALIRVRAHTGYQAWADRELLAGLLATIERITDAALAKLGDKS